MADSPTHPDRPAWQGDLAAGLTVAAMLVPQAMAYALLAGLPPQVGLYASTVPLVAYAVLGTSRQLAVGPVAIVSLLTASSLSGVVDEGSASYLEAAALLAVLVGAIHLVLAAARLGFLVRLLSHPVLIGFTAAAGIIIATSQVKHVLGVSISRTEHFHETVAELFRSASEIHVLTLVIGAAAIAGLTGLRRWAPGFPGALTVVSAFIAISTVWNLAGHGVATVGEVPSGLPSPSLPAEWGLVADLLPAAFVITLVGFMESIAVAKVYARRHAYAIEPNRELLGLGAANISAGLFGGYPVTGGFSRTAVNADAGATTKRAAVVTAVMVALVVVAFTPLLENLPAAVLGAIVIVAVSRLIDIGEIRRVVRLKRADALTMAVAFVATLALGVELGIGVAMASSAVVVFARMMTPHTAVLGRVPGTRLYRNVARFPDAETSPELAIVRFDVSLSYLNVDFMKRRVTDLLAACAADRRPGKLRAIVIDAAGVNDIDVSAVEALGELIDDLAEREIELHITDAKGPIRDMLRRSGLRDRLDGRLHNEVADAVDCIKSRSSGDLLAESAKTPAD